MRRKKGNQQDAPAGRDRRITPDDVQQVEFRLAFRGYNERDVDAFLDRVTEDLVSYLEEVERLRSASHATGTPTGGSVDASEAEGILARAREEAAEIVRRAQQQAEAVRRPTGAGDARAAVAPFLSREREFLQGLGSLIQSHAEEIRQMVHAVRPPAEPSEPVQAPASSGAAPEASAAVEGSPEPEAADEPIVVERAEEPALSSDAAPTERRERSLRELFWGEE
ncbi:MAG TPA: DivIVA domain-containing protein [Actinomycetota bacterium]